MLAFRALLGYLQLVVALAVVLFVPNWKHPFWQGAAYLAVFAGCSALITLYLLRNDPGLLERRVRAGVAAEPEPVQRLIQACAAVAFIATLLVPALDHRFGWSYVPAGLVVSGDVLVALGFLAVFFVFRANSYTAATVGVEPGQQIVTTGPYALVRHPMYAGALALLFGTPVALGSWWGLIAFVPMTAIIVWRLRAEERLLARELPGYVAYCTRVRYRLVPGVW